MRLILRSDLILMLMLMMHDYWIKKSFPLLVKLFAVRYQLLKVSFYLNLILNDIALIIGQQLLAYLSSDFEFLGIHLFRFPHNNFLLSRQFYEHQQWIFWFSVYQGFLWLMSSKNLSFKSIHLPSHSLLYLLFFQSLSLFFVSMVKKLILTSTFSHLFFHPYW